MLDARQHVSSVGYLSTLMTTSTHANPTNSTEASRFEEGGAGGFGAASKASGAGHVPFVPLSGGAREVLDERLLVSRGADRRLRVDLVAGNCGAGGRSAPCAMRSALRQERDDSAALQKHSFASTSCVSPFAAEKGLRATACQLMDR